MSWKTQIRLALHTALLAAGTAAAAMAQCSMCRTALQAQGPRAASAMNAAILILLVPAVALFSSVFLLAFRLRAPEAADPADNGLCGVTGDEQKGCEKTIS